MKIDLISFSKSAYQSKLERSKFKVFRFLTFQSELNYQK